MKGWRTLAFNAAMTLIMVVKQWMPEAEIPTEGDVNVILDQVQVGMDNFDKIWSGVMAFGNAFLRLITNTGVGKKE